MFNFSDWKCNILRLLTGLPLLIKLFMLFIYLNNENNTISLWSETKESKEKHLKASQPVKTKPHQ